MVSTWSFAVKADNSQLRGCRFEPKYNSVYCFDYDGIWRQKDANIKHKKTKN